MTRGCLVKPDHLNEASPPEMKHTPVPVVSFLDCKMQVLVLKLSEDLMKMLFQSLDLCLNEIFNLCDKIFMIRDIRS